MIDLSKAHQFVALASSGSYAAAARELHISQPALTRNIQWLERSQGVRLIDRERGRSGLALTPAGVEFLRHAAALLKSAADAERAMDRWASQQRQELDFGLGPMLANTVLSSVLSDMLRDFPDLTTTVSVGDADSMIARLVARKIEFYVGVAPASPLPARVVAEDFGRVGVSFYVRAGHPLERQQSVAVEDVLRYAIISGTAWKKNLLRLDDSQDRRLFEAAVLMDNYASLVQIAASTNSILVSAYDPSGGALHKLPIGVDIADDHSKLMTFTLADMPLSAAGEEHLRRLKLAHESRQSP